MSLNKNEINDKVIQILADQLHIDKEHIHPESKLVDDLGMDSFAAVELLFGLEEQYNIQIPDEDAKNFKIVNNITDYLENLV